MVSFPQSAGGLPEADRESFFFGGIPDKPASGGQAGMTDYSKVLKRMISFSNVFCGLTYLTAFSDLWLNIVTFKNGPVRLER
jgi:hypothetical protein